MQRTVENHPSVRQHQSIVLTSKGNSVKSNTFSYQINSVLKNLQTERKLL